jgi:signal transduction histidine kinase
MAAAAHASHDGDRRRARAAGTLKEPGMAELTILVTAYVAGCVAVALRWERARGESANTLLGRIRGLGWGVFLLPAALTGFGLFGGNHLPTFAALLLAGIAVVFAPGRAAKALPIALLALGFYGFVLALRYDYGSNVQFLYGVVLAGAGSWRTHLVLPQAIAFLAAGVWLLQRTYYRQSRIATALLGPPAWTAGRATGAGPHNPWRLALLPVAGLTLELLGPNWLFGASEWADIRNGAVVLLAALLVVILLPAVAADLAVAGLVGLGIYGAVLAVRWPGMTGPRFRDMLYGAVYVTNRPLAALACVQGLALLAFGLWLVPRALDSRTRALLWPAPDTALAGRVQQLTQTRADALDTAAAELRRLERDLHDGAQARLVALGMSLRAAQRLIPDSPQAAQSLVAEAIQTSSRALTELRDLVRGIHPPVLADRGLGDAVRALALDTPLHTVTDIDLPGRIDAPVESACYFAVAEALANAVKHSGARHVQIRMQHADGMLRIEVTDDGAGGADPRNGSGLSGLERRLGTFDGILAVSSPPGGPTMVVIEVPCALSLPKTSSC